MTFTLDRFQREAVAAIEADRNVLVAAPTGAGKTVVADHAVIRALAQGRRAFYTTPIKALSNQKYADLVRAHGPDRVGLLTGDNAINADAPVVVMTTEVLRNMVYSGSRAIEDLGWVILDEVHYLQDPYRGPVWEEVLIHAPTPIRFVCLSATVSNAEELGAWIESCRGPTEVVVETERPVELINHFLVFDKATRQLVQVETLVGGRPNPEAERFDRPGGSGGGSHRGRHRGGRRWGTPRREEVVDHLHEAQLLPAIYFIFSRAACDEAAQRLVDRGTVLTSPRERERIRAIAEHHVERLSPTDLAVLGHDRWLRGLLAGVGAHHAGMVPPFKEAVEACFIEGLVKVVFATETLALGLNMPARSVVIETLSKFTGETHEDLTPSQYTQLTGRAGRRGIDPVGHALVLWSPWYGFDKVAALASSREYLLLSAFRPTPNMVVNLINRHDETRAHELLGRSFAQFQADRSLGRLVQRRAKALERRDQAEQDMVCDRGDIEAHRRRRAHDDSRRRAERAALVDDIEEAVESLRPGHVILVDGVRLAVVSTAFRRGEVRLHLVDTKGRFATLNADAFDRPPEPVAHLRLPTPYEPRSRRFQDRTGALLARAVVKGIEAAADPEESSESSGGGGVESCPDLARHLEAADERDRLQRRIDELGRRIDHRRGSLVRQFDLIHGLLERWQFVDGWELTVRGEVLSRVFHESDLLCALVVCEGVLDGLSPAELAAVVSMLTYEHRSKEPPPEPWYPSRLVRRRAADLEDLVGRLNRDEVGLGLPPTRHADPSFMALAYAWVAGESFQVVNEDELLSGGDFVRNIKTLIDLLRQIAEVAPHRDTRSAAAQAAEAMFHGVVAAASDVGAALEADPHQGRAVGTDAGTEGQPGPGPSNRSGDRPPGGQGLD